MGAQSVVSLLAPAPAPEADPKPMRKPSVVTTKMTVSKKAVAHPATYKAAVATVTTRLKTDDSDWVIASLAFAMLGALLLALKSVA